MTNAAHEMTMPHDTNPTPVFFARCPEYDSASVVRLTGELLEAVSFRPSRGENVLVKPNLLKADTRGCVCTNAAVIAAACVYLKDCGCRVTIGDSPGFGTAAGVARAIGLIEALKDASCGDVPVIGLNAPVTRPLSFGGTVGISRYALDADRILDLPKLKAHTQMRVTCAVKNLFGCVSGIRKAVLHTLHGDVKKQEVSVFPAVVADIAFHLPPVTALLDAVSAMHVTGPGNGQPYQLGLLAASSSPVALDTAVYTLLRVDPEDVPVWKELQRRALPEAFPGGITVKGAEASSFDASGFMLPQNLTPQTFNPFRLAVSTLRRLWAGLTR